MNCDNCGQQLRTSGISTCAACAKQQAVSDLVHKVLLPLLTSGIMLSLVYLLVHDSRAWPLFLFLLAGIPFGVVKMWRVLSEQNLDRGTVALIFAVNLGVAWVIGGFVMTWRLVCAAFYLCKAGLMLYQASMRRPVVKAKQA